MSEFNAQTVAEITEKLRVASENSANIYNLGIEMGKKSEYDLFWDTFQKNGSRRYYERAFSDTTNGCRLWMYGENYKPKYPMKPLAANEMYSYGNLPYEAIAAVDFSECKDFYCTFSYFAISNADKKFPPIDISSATRTQSMFAWATGIKEIEEISVSENTPYSGTFNNTTNLVEIRFKGTIGQNGLDFKSCTKLSKASIENIIQHLSTETVGLKLTLSKAAVDKAYETSEGANDGSDNSVWFDDKLGYRPNWTITLV